MTHTINTPYKGYNHHHTWNKIRSTFYWSMKISSIDRMKITTLIPMLQDLYNLSKILEISSTLTYEFQFDEYLHVLRKMIWNFRLTNEPSAMDLLLEIDLMVGILTQYTWKDATNRASPCFQPQSTDTCFDARKTLPLPIQTATKKVLFHNLNLMFVYLTIFENMRFYFKTKSISMESTNNIWYRLSRTNPEPKRYLINTIIGGNTCGASVQNNRAFSRILSAKTDKQACRK